MYYIVLTILVFLPPSLGLVDCLSACKQCKAHDKAPEIVEVYCAMCKECIDRRKERKLKAHRQTDKQEQVERQAEGQVEGPPEAPVGGPAEEPVEGPAARQKEKQSERQANFYDIGGFSNYCPPPPRCEPEIEYVAQVTPQKLKSTTSTTTTTTTSTTTQRPCPTAPPCKKRMPRPPPCIPCMPMCPCPYPPNPLPSSFPHSGPVHQHLVETSPTSTTEPTGYLYVYVGVPKDVLNKIQK